MIVQFNAVVMMEVDLPDFYKDFTDDEIFCFLDLEIERGVFEFAQREDRKFALKVRDWAMQDPTRLLRHEGKSDAGRR